MKLESGCCLVAEELIFADELAVADLDDVGCSDGLADNFDGCSTGTAF